MTAARWLYLGRSPAVAVLGVGNDLAPNLLSLHLPSDQKDHGANTGKNVFDPGTA